VLQLWHPQIIQPLIGRVCNSDPFSARQIIRCKWNFKEWTTR
jgi:hypothetical protein